MGSVMLLVKDGTILYMFLQLIIAFRVRKFSPTTGADVPCCEGHGHSVFKAKMVEPAGILPYLVSSISTLGMLSTIKDLYRTVRLYDDTAMQQAIPKGMQLGQVISEGYLLGKPRSHVL